MKSKIVKPKNLGNSQTNQLHSINFSLLSASQQMDDSRATLNYHKQQIINEELFDTFMENSLVLPLNEAFEPLIKQMFHSEKCVLWIDQPEQQILYSPTYSLTAGYINSIPGFIYKTKNVIQVRDPSQAPGGYLSDQRIASPNSPQLFFPIITLGTVRGVVQIVKKQGSNGFSEYDMQITSQIMRKFSIYGDSLFTSKSLSQIALSLYSGSTNQTSNNSKQNLNPLELIQKHFHCQKVELFHFDTSRMTCQLYDPSRHEMIPITSDDDNDFGLVGFSVTSQTTINSNDPKNESHFSTVFDSKIEGPLLIVSMMSGKRDGWSVALRGRQKTFSTSDESQLSALLPFLVRSIAGFSSSGEQSQFNAQLTELLEAAASLTMISTSTKIKTSNLASILTSMSSECIEKAEIGKLIEEKSVSLMQCEKSIVYLVDSSKNEFYAVNNSNGMRKRFSIQKGIAAKIFKEKSAVNLTDPLSDDLFSPEIDSKQGYSPKSLLGAPIFASNEVCGVILLLTKNDSDSFDANDEKVLKAFNTFAGIALQNAELYRSSVNVTQKIRSFFDLTRHTNQESQLKPLFEDILIDVQLLIQSTCISLFTVDDDKRTLALYCAVGANQSGGFGTAFSMKAYQERKKVTFNQSEIKKAFPKHRSQDKSATAQPQGITEIFEGGNNYLTTPSSTSSSKENESLICVPLFNKETAVLGVIEFHFTLPHKNEIDLTDSIAELASTFLEKSDIKSLRSLGHGDIELRDWMSDEERIQSQVSSKLSIEREVDCRTVLTPEFNALKWDGIGLFKVIFYIFDHFDLMKPFEITNEILFTFLVHIRRLYSVTSNHNFRHAVTVTQFIASIISSAEKDKSFPSIFSKDKLLVLFVAAICHDVDHDFELTPDSLLPFKVLLGQQSALETRSCAASIAVLSRLDCDLFKSFKSRENGEEELTKAWRLFIDLVISTDMARHKEIVDEMSQLVERGELDLEGKEAHRLLLMKSIIKCADFENAARPFEISDKEKLDTCEEFFLQCDMKSEKSENEGETDFKAKVLTFYNSICLPLFELTSKAMPSVQKSYVQVKSNIEKWKSNMEKGNEK